jgi:hypothetical protein
MMTFEGEGKTHDAHHLWEILLPNSRDMVTCLASEQ